MNNKPILDWAPHFDERSRNYPIREVIREASPRRRNKLWRVGPVTDQGSEGACVGHGWTTEALATPVAVDLNRISADVPRIPNSFAQYIYESAKKVDYWPGEDYSGTSVLGGAKAMQSVGLLKEYRWAFSIQDVIDSILTKSPVVLGMNWYEGMYEAPNGVLSVSGPLVGGHCLTAVGYSVEYKGLGGEDTIILRNSWGPSWGKNGLAEIKVSELEALLMDNGEACVPTKRSYGRG